MVLHVMILHSSLFHWQLSSHCLSGNIAQICIARSISIINHIFQFQYNYVFIYLGTFLTKIIAHYWFFFGCATMHKAFEDEALGKTIHIPYDILLFLWSLEHLQLSCAWLLKLNVQSELLPILRVKWNQQLTVRLQTYMHVLYMFGKITLVTLAIILSRFLNPDCCWSWKMCKKKINKYHDVVKLCHKWKVLNHSSEFHS